MRDRDFEVIVEDANGEKMKFVGKKCRVHTKGILARLGLTNVKETLTCEKVNFESKRG